MIRLAGLANFKRPVNESAMSQMNQAMGNLEEAAKALGETMEKLDEAREIFYKLHEDVLKVDVNLLVGDIARAQGKCNIILNKAEKLFGALE